MAKTQKKYDTAAKDRQTAADSTSKTKLLRRVNCKNNRNTPQTNEKQK